MHEIAARTLALACLMPLSQGCDLYYRIKADEMIERQMNAMVFVKGGEFMMGNPGGWDGSQNSWPPHQVVLDDFHIQKFEVTQGDFELFQTVSGYTSSFKYYHELREEKPEHFASELPAIASWIDASAFCRWLGDKSGKRVDLPTEAQWEYAARSRGKMHRYATSTGHATAGVTMAAGPASHSRYGVGYLEILPLPPGSYSPNELGLYDMSGNMGEWVRDYYDPDYYKNSPTHNPVFDEGASINELTGYYTRVRRGGNFTNFIGNTTVIRRHVSQPLASVTVGFRCAIRAHSSNLS